VGRDSLTLAIETSNPSSPGCRPGVAIGLLGPGGAEVLGVEALASESRHDDDLMPAIDRLWRRLAGAGRVASKREIALVAVSAGPGGFTGVRVAVAAAKSIAEACGAMCVGVPSAAVAARRVSAGLAAPFGVLLASKRQTAVATVFEGPGGPWGEPVEVDAPGLEALGVRAVVADGFLPEAMHRVCVRLGLPVEPPVFDAAGCLEAAAGLEAVDPASLMPIYGREPEAVRRWRELHGEGGRGV
jgi:tRNA threonylcarbamoyladenosine biosynthesis protein TsaB